MKPSDEERMLLTAARKAGEAVGLTDEDVEGIVTLSRSDDELKDFASQVSTERCAQFVRVCLSLDAILGDSRENLQHWLHSDNRTLGGAPLFLMKKDAGLAAVENYLSRNLNR